MILKQCIEMLKCIIGLIKYRKWKEGKEIERQL